METIFNLLSLFQFSRRLQEVNEVKLQKETFYLDMCLIFNLTKLDRNGVMVYKRFHLPSIMMCLV